MNELQGMSVLVTRPAPQGLELCNMIESAGGKALYFPTIEILPPKNQAHFLQTIPLLKQQNWLIFISPQAVLASIKVIGEIPKKVKIATIGAGTAQLLKAHGYQDIYFPKKNWTSEGLLDLPEFQSIQEKKIAIIRGEGGRDLLEKTLTQRGAQILPVIAYQRALPKINKAKEIKWLQPGILDTIICTSGDTLKNLQKLVAAEHHTFLQTIPLIVVSERIKKLAQDLGFQTIWIAENASNAMLLAMLKQKRKDLWQKTNKS